MADTADTTEGAGAPEPTPEPLPAAAARRRRTPVLWGVLAVLVLGAGVLVVQSQDDDPPRLPVTLGASSAEAKMAAPTSGASTDMALARWVTYVAGDDLPELGGTAPAYRLRGAPDEAQVRKLARALGIDAAPTHHDGGWTMQGETGQLEVGDGAGGTWWYTSGAALKSRGQIEPDAGGGSAGSSGSGTAVAPPPEAVVPSCPEGTKCDEPVYCTADGACPEPAPFVPPADLPTKAEAQAKALDLLRSIGADVEQADVTVDGPYDSWYVGVQPRIDGTVTSGMGWSVQVGPKGVITGAGGTLAAPDRLGDYPVLTTRAAIDRLNAAGQGGPQLYARDDAAMETSSANAGAPDLPVTTTIDPALIDPAMPPTTAVGGGDTPITIEPMPTEPYVPPEPQEVVLHGAERILIVVGASDGSGDAYLVPGYRLTGDDDAVVDQIAVDDDSLLPDQASVDGGEVPPIEATVVPPVAAAVGETKPDQ